MSHLKSLLLAAALLTPGLANAVVPDSTDPTEIMNAVESRDTGDQTTFTLDITIEDKAGRSRTRVVQVRTLRFDEGNKQLLLFEQPADLRNAGLLSIDYDDGSKADDQWLYLPSLARTTRIASADKSGSFMGTDLTYADMTRKDPGAYNYKMYKQSEMVDGDDCWVIEATPKTDKERDETGYAASLVWVSKDKMVPLKLQAKVIDGARMKYTSMSDLRQVDGVWMAHKVVVNTYKGGEKESGSTLVTSNLNINDAGVSESDFTEQRLERGL